MKMDSDNPIMALVVERDSRRIIDCKQIAYTWDMDSLLERHDMSRVDIVWRAPERTQPVAPVEAPPVDDDIPF